MCRALKWPWNPPAPAQSVWSEATSSNLCPASTNTTTTTTLDLCEGATENTSSISSYLFHCLTLDRATWAWPPALSFLSTSNCGAAMFWYPICREGSRNPQIAARLVNSHGEGLLLRQSLLIHQSDMWSTCCRGTINWVGGKRNWKKGHGYTKITVYASCFNSLVVWTMWRKSMQKLMQLLFWSDTSAHTQYLLSSHSNPQVLLVLLLLT